MAPPVVASTTTTTTTRGTIHDNPWAGIEPSRNDHDNDGNNNNNNNNNQATRTAGRLVLHEGFWLQMLDMVIQMLLCLDACAGMFWLIFGTILHYKHEHDSSIAVAIMGGLGCLYMVRAALVTAGLWISTDSVFSCERGGLVVAGYLSAGMAVILGAGTLWGLFGAKQVQAYMQTHSLDLKDYQIQWLLDHYAWIMIILAIGGAVEGAKWLMYGIYHRSLLLWEDEQERLENQNLIRREAATGRPWWWSSNSNSRHRHRTRNAQLTQALLADDVEHRHDGGDGSTTQQHRRPRQRRGLFSLFRRRRDPADTSARDDGSVDFASVQEEWASRAEEDPVWWSRDDDGGGDDDMNNISRVTTDVDTSWARDVSQV